jgi:hypothetical protein
MDIVKDIKGNVVNVGDKIKFMYCEFGKPQERKYIISKISKIDYEEKEVYMESGHSCRYSILSEYERKHLTEKEKELYDNRIGGEKVD